METYKIEYSSIYDLIFYLISIQGLMPFYTLKVYKGYVYFYEMLGECITLHYTKSNIESGIYIFDTLKINLKKQESIPKIIEQNQFIIIFNKLEKDTLFNEIIES